MTMHKCNICAAPTELFAATASSSANQRQKCAHKSDNRNNLGCGVKRKYPKMDIEQRPNNLDKLHWVHRNRQAISKISLMLKRPLSYATNFLYELRFSRDKGKGNNTLIRTKKKLRSCHIPLINFELGYVYEDIFNEKGNLRDPLSRETLKKLLRTMRDAFIEKPKDNKAERINIFKIIGLKSSPAKRNEQGCLGGCAAPNGIRRKKQNFYTIDGRFSNKLKAENMIGYNWGDESNALYKKRTGSNLGSGLGTIRKDKYAYDSIAYNDGLNDMTMFEFMERNDDDVRDAIEQENIFNERYDNFYTRRAGENDDRNRLTSQSVQFKSLLEDYNDGTDLNNYLDNLKSKKNYGKSNKSTINDIAYYYNELVDAKKSGRPYEIPRREYREQANNFDENRVIVSKISQIGENNNKRNTEYRRSDRKYYGAQLPVLMHEPFSDTKPWTWLRRHPTQKRVTSQGHVTGSRIHRYRRASEEERYQAAKRRWSVHSIVSRGSNISGLSHGIFGL